MQNVLESLNRQDMPQSNNTNLLNFSFETTKGGCSDEAYQEIEKNLEYLFRNTDDCNKNDNSAQDMHATVYNNYEIANYKLEEIHINGDINEKVNKINNNFNVNDYNNINGDKEDFDGNKSEFVYQNCKMEDNNRMENYNNNNFSKLYQKKIMKKTKHNRAGIFKQHTFMNFDKEIIENHSNRNFVANNNTNIIQKSPLIEACINGNLKEVQKLISSNNNVQIFDNNKIGENLILLASGYGHYDLVKEFLNLGINVDGRGDRNDTTPLMEAVSAGHLNIVELLVVNGANINAKSKSKNTPLIFASINGYEEIVEYLIEHRALIDCCNHVGFNALLEAINSDHLEIVKILLQNGANVNYCLPDSNETALSIASYKRDCYLVNLLLKFGAARTEIPNLTNDIALTTLLSDQMGDYFDAPLTLAARGGHIDIALLLIERGVDKEQINIGSNYTPLMEACREGYHEMVVLFLSHGVNVNTISTQTRETALSIASSLGFILIANSLLQAGANIELGAKSPLILAITHGEVEMVQFLLDSGANLHARPLTHDTALGYACKLGYTKITEILLYYGADPNQISEDGRTPLMKACYSGHLDIVKLLVKYKANVNKQTINNDYTPLSLACTAGHFKIVEFLLLSEADPYHRIKDNSTMIIEAAKGGYTEIVKMLIDYPRSIIRDDIDHVHNLISIQHQTIMHPHNNQHEQHEQHEHHQPTYLYKHMSNHNCHNDNINCKGINNTNVNDSNNNDYNNDNHHIIDVNHIDYLTTFEENCDLLRSLGLIDDNDDDDDDNDDDYDGDDGDDDDDDENDEVDTNILSSVPSSDLLHMSQYEENTLSKWSLDDLTTIDNDYSNFSDTDLRFNKLAELFEDDINVITALEIIEKDEALNLDFESKFIYENTDSKLTLEENRQKLEIIEEIKKAERNFTNFMIQAYSDGTSAGCTLDISNLINNNGVSVNTVTAKTVTTTTTSTAVMPTHVMPVSSTSITLIDKESRQKTKKSNSLKTDKYKTIPTNKKYSSCRNDVFQKATDYLLCLAEKNDPIFQDFLNYDFESSTSNKFFGEIIQTLEEISFDDTTDLFKGLIEALDLEDDDDNDEDDEYIDYDDYDYDDYDDDDNDDELEEENNHINNTKELVKCSDNVIIDFDITHVEDDNLNQIDIHEKLLRSEFGNYSIIGIINRNDNNNIVNSVKNNGDITINNDSNKKNVNVITNNSNKINEKNNNEKNNIYENGGYLNFFEYNSDDSGSGDSRNKNNRNEEIDIFCFENFEKSSIAFRKKFLKQEQYRLPDIHLKTTFTESYKLTPGENLSKIYKKLPNQLSNYEERKCMSIDELAEKCFKEKLIEAQELRRDRSRKKAKMVNLSKFQEKMKKNQKKQSRSILNQTKIIEKNMVKKDDALFINKNIEKKKQLIHNCKNVTSDSSIGVNQIKNISTKRNLFNDNELFQTSITSVYVDNVTDTNNDTALTIAASNGYLDLVELLLSRGANIEHCDKKGFTSLIHASVRGFEQVVDFLLEKGADIEVQSERTKDTPLSLACSGGKYNVVELLLMRGANKEHRNVSDYTPLSLAASNGYLDIIRLLLHHGAEINSHTGSKLCITPLMLAAMNGHTDAVRLLIDYGGDVNGQIETNKNTALTLACFQGRSQVVNVLLDYKANIEHRAKTGLTPLMEAASGGFVEVGKILIARKADVNAPPVPSSRDTALTIAADKGHIEFVKLLITHKAIIDVKNKKGNSPLWLAANSGHLQVVQYLYQHGANIDSQDNRKISCLMTAFRKGHVNVVCWMVNLVSQLPNECELTKYLSSIMINIEDFARSSECLEIIARAKHARVVRANEHAANLLKEISMEKNREDSRRSVGGYGGGGSGGGGGYNSTGSGNTNKKRYKKKKDRKKKNTDKKRHYAHVDRNDNYNNLELMKESLKSKFIQHDIYSESLLPIYSVKSKHFEQADNSGLCHNATNNSYKQEKNCSKIISNNISKKDRTHRIVDSIDNGIEINGLSDSLNINRINNKKNINNNNDNTTETKKVKKKKHLINNNLDDLNVQKCGNNSIVKIDSSLSNTNTIYNIKNNDYQSKKPKNERKLNKIEKKSFEQNNDLSKDVKEITNKHKDSKAILVVATSVTTSNVLTLSTENNKPNRYELPHSDFDLKPIPKLELIESSDLIHTISSKTITSPISSDLNLNNSITTGYDTDTNGWKKVGKKVAVKKGVKKIFVPLQAIPRIIGKAGKNINLIRSSSGAQIEIEKQRKNQSQRTITLKGPIDATRRAYLMLDALIHDNKIDVATLVKKFSTNVSIDEQNIEANISFVNENINVPITTGFNYDCISDRNLTAYSKTTRSNFNSNAAINAVSLSQSNFINANNKYTTSQSLHSTNANIWNTVQKVDSRLNNGLKQSTLSTVTTSTNQCNQTTLTTNTNYSYTTALKSNYVNCSTQFNNSNDTRMQFLKNFDEKSIINTTSNTILSNNLNQSKNIGCNSNVSPSEYNQKIPFSAILNANKINYSKNEYQSNPAIKLNANNKNIDSNIKQLPPLSLSSTLPSFKNIQSSANLNKNNMSTSKSQSATTSPLITTSSTVNYISNSNIPEYSLFYNSFPSIDKVSSLSRQNNQNDLENQFSFTKISNNQKSNICDKSNSISKLLESNLVIDSIDDNIDISKAPGYRKDNNLFSKSKFKSSSASIMLNTTIATATTITTTTTSVPVSIKNLTLSSTLPLTSTLTSSLVSSIPSSITMTTPINKCSPSSLPSSLQTSLSLPKSTVSISTPSLSLSNHCISCVNSNQLNPNNISSYSSHSLSNSFSSGLCSNNSDNETNLTSSLSLNCINDSVYSATQIPFKDYRNDKHLNNMVLTSRLNPSAPDFMSTLYSKSDQNYQYQQHQNRNNQHNLQLQQAQLKQQQLLKESQQQISSLQEEQLQKEQKQLQEQESEKEHLSQQQEQYNQLQSQLEQKYYHEKQSSQQHFLNNKHFSADDIESILSNPDQFECLKQKIKEYQIQEQLKYFTQQLQINNNMYPSNIANNVNYLTNYDYFLNSQDFYKEKLNSSLVSCNNNIQNHNKHLLTNLNQNPIGIERTWKKFNENYQITLEQQNAIANNISSSSHNHMPIITVPSSVPVSTTPLVDNLQYIDYCDSNFDGHFESNNISWSNNMPSKYNNPFWNNIPIEEIAPTAISTHNLMNTVPTAVMLPSTINSTGSTVTTTPTAFYKNPNIMTYALQMNALNTNLNPISTFDENNFIDNYMQSNNLLNHCNSQQLSFMQSTPFQLVSPYYNLNNQVIDQYYQYAADMNNSNIVDVAGISTAATVANAGISSAPVNIIPPDITFE